MADKDKKKKKKKEKELVKEVIQEAVQEETAAAVVETEAEPCPMCAGKKKERSEKERKSLTNRLSRIEGQVRGVKAMLEKDAYCTEIMTQVAAINAALNSFNKELLNEHLHTCVAEGVRSGNEEVLDELAALLQKLMK